MFVSKNLKFSGQDTKLKEINETYIIILMIINTFNVLVLLCIQGITVSLAGLDEERFLYPHVGWQHQYPGVGPPPVDVIRRRLLYLLESDKSLLKCLDNTSRVFPNHWNLCKPESTAAITKAPSLLLQHCQNGLPMVHQ